MKKIYPPGSYKPLHVDNGQVAEFDGFFRQLRTRWLKVERLQEYDEASFPGYQAFKRKDLPTAQRLVQEMVRRQDDLYRFAHERHVSMVRIRIYDLPLSAYLQDYEMYAYEADVQCGEDIRFLDSADIEDLLAQTGISDYLLFDSQRVVALLYDPTTGRLNEARLVEHGRLISQYVAVSEELMARSVPMLQSPIYQAWAARTPAATLTRPA
jgi:Family of unknown function (DUF6879)